MATQTAKPVRILICGNYGAGNFGDELILKGLLKVVRQLRNVHVTVTSGNPEETRRLHGESIATCPFVPSSAGSWVKNILNGKAFRAISAIRKSDLVMFGGGGLFSEKEERSMQIWASQARMWKRLKKRAIIVGQSFGDITQPRYQKIIRDVCASMKKICVRDNASKKMLEQLGVKHAITVLSDSALWLTDEDFSRDEKSHSSDLSSVAFDAYALISLRTWPNLDHEELTRKVKEFATYLREHYHLSLKFIVMQKGDTIDDARIPHIVPKNLDDLWAVFKHASLVVAMRLHACILAVRTRKPLLALSYDEKVKNLLTDLGLQGVIADLQAPTATWQQQLKNPQPQLQKSAASIQADQHTLLKILTKSIKSI